MAAEIKAGARRSRRWSLIAALIAVVLVAVGLLLPSLARSGADAGRPFPLDQAVPVEFDPPAQRMLWAQGDFPPAGLTCDFATDGRAAGVAVEWMLFEPVEVGDRWRGVLELRADQPGTYAVTCTTTPAAGGVEPTLSIGTPPRFLGARARVLTTLASGLLILGGLLAAGLLVGVVARRRHR